MFDFVPDEPLRSALLHAKRAATYHPGVVGVDFGLLFEGPQRRVRGEGIRFHVRHKRPPSLVPVAEELPKEILGIRCDVLQVSYQSHTASPKSPLNPIQPGISIGNRSTLTAGTLGCFVRDRTGAACLLSNWHILSGDPSVPMGAQVVQPAIRHLGGAPPRTVATLVDTVFFSHNVDAAIARLLNGVDIDPRTFASALVATTVAEPRVGMTVVKFGVGSDLTHGFIDGVGGHYLVPYEFQDDPIWMPGFHLVRNPSFPEIEITQGGDSGSVWLEEATGSAVGLHFAGEDNTLTPMAEFALAHPMSQVLKLLESELLS